MNRSSVIASVALLCVAAVGVAGCSDSKDPQVASAGGTPTATAASDVVATYVEAVRGYVKCVRGEGVKVTDPDAKGKFTFEGDLKQLKADSKFIAAQQKCRSLLPPAPAGLDDKPVQSAEQIEKVRQYAKCMRENGAPDFPDPGPDGYFGDRTSGVPSWDSTTEGARRATAACGPLIGAPASTGPGQG